MNLLRSPFLAQRKRLLELIDQDQDPGRADSQQAIGEKAQAIVLGARSKNLLELGDRLREDSWSPGAPALSPRTRVAALPACARRIGLGAARQRITVQLGEWSRGVRTCQAPSLPARQSARLKFHSRQVWSKSYHVRLPFQPNVLPSFSAGLLNETGVRLLYQIVPGGFVPPIRRPAHGRSLPGKARRRGTAWSGSKSSSSRSARAKWRWPRSSGRPRLWHCGVRLTAGSQTLYRQAKAAVRSAACRCRAPAAPRF